MQVDKTGKAVKVDADGFPDVESLDLETDQNQLRYEAYQHMAAQRAKVSPIGDDGSADTPPGRTHAWEQGRPSSSSSRTPFADSRPQTDRYTVALLGFHDDFLGLCDDLLGLHNCLGVGGQSLSVATQCCLLRLMTGLQMVSAQLHAWTDACLQAEHCLFLCPGVALQCTAV